MGFSIPCFRPDPKISIAFFRVLKLAIVSVFAYPGMTSVNWPVKTFKRSSRELKIPLLLRKISFFSKMYTTPDQNAKKPPYFRSKWSKSTPLQKIRLQKLKHHNTFWHLRYIKRETPSHAKVQIDVIQNEIQSILFINTWEKKPSLFCVQDTQRVMFFSRRSYCSIMHDRRKDLQLNIRTVTARVNQEKTIIQIFI